MPRPRNAKPSLTTCPNGHTLPRVTARGQCTPLHCVGDERAKVTDVALVPAKKKEAPARESARDGDYGDKLAMRATQKDARRELVPVPVELEGEAAEKWADEKIVKLLPRAVAEIEFQLEYGSDEQRERAANKILDATGRGKTERGSAGSAPIILLNMTPSSLPWAQRVEKKDAAQLAAIQGEGEKK